MKKRIFFIVNVIISVSLIVYIFHKYIKVDDLLLAWHNINYSYFVPFFILLVLSRVVDALQLTTFLNDIKIKISTFSVFRSKYISNFYGLVLPGDIVTSGITWHLISKEHGNKTNVATCLFFNKLLYFITLIPYMLFGFIYNYKLINHFIGINNLLLIVFILIFFILLLFFFVNIKFRNFAAKIINLLPDKFYLIKLKTLFFKIIDSILIINKIPARAFLKILFYSLINHLVVIVCSYFFLCAMDIYLPLTASLFWYTINVGINLLPISINGSGIREISAIYFFGNFYGIANEKALTFSLFGYVVSTIFIAIPGGFFAIFNRKKKTKIIENQISY